MMSGKKLVQTARLAVRSPHMPPVLVLIALLAAGSVLQWSYVQSVLSTEETITVKDDLLDGLKRAVVRMSSAASARSAVSAKNAPYIVGETETIAAAAFQAHVLAIIEAQSATVYSTHIQSSAQDGSVTDTTVVGQSERRIVLGLSFDTHTADLQQILFKLETGVPTIIVDEVDIQPQHASEATETTDADPKLRVVLSLVGFWRST